MVDDLIPPTKLAAWLLSDREDPIGPKDKTRQAKARRQDKTPQKGGDGERERERERGRRSLNRCVRLRLKRKRQKTREKMTHNRNMKDRHKRQPPTYSSPKLAENASRAAWNEWRSGGSSKGGAEQAASTGLHSTGGRVRVRVMVWAQVLCLGLRRMGYGLALGLGLGLRSRYYG
jgi:hypothetical protein